MIPLILALIGTTAAPESLLARAGFNRPAWESALSTLDGFELARCVWLLGELRELDLMEIDEATILSHVHGCTRAMEGRPEYVVPEDTLRSFILNPRTGHYDMVTEWRTELWAVFRDRCTGDFGPDVATVISHLRDQVAIEARADAFGPPSPPGGTFRRGWGSAEEWASLAVAGLRAIGIAARLSDEGKGVEAWNGLQWQRVHQPGGDSPKLDTARATAVVELRLTADSRPWRNTEQLGLSRWIKGAWRPVEPPVYPVYADVTDSSILVSAPPGDYLVTGGVRNARGEPRIWCAEVSLRADSAIALSADLSIPFTQMGRPDLVESPEPALEGIVLKDSLGNEVSLGAILGAGRPSLIAAVEPGAELSERVVSALESRRGELEAHGVLTLLVAPRDAVRTTLWVDSERSLWSALGLDGGRAPALILVSPGGEVLVFKRGAGPHTVELALASLRRTLD